MNRILVLPLSNDTRPTSTRAARWIDSIGEKSCFRVRTRCVTVNSTVVDVLVKCSPLFDQSRTRTFPLDSRRIDARIYFDNERDVT
jgi:hypothetical protein